MKSFMSPKNHIKSPQQHISLLGVGQQISTLLGGPLLNPLITACQALGLLSAWLFFPDDAATSELCPLYIGSFKPKWKH